MARLVYVIAATGNATEANRNIRIQVNQNFSGDCFSRVYEDGGVAPAFTAMNTDGDGFKFYQFSNLAPGLYVVEFKDDNGEIVLGKLQIHDESADTCYPEFTLPGLGYFSAVLFPDRLRIIHDTGIWAGHTTSEAQAAGARQVSIDGGNTWKNITLTLPSSTVGIAEWTNSELDSMGLVSTIDQIIIRRNSDSCTDTLGLQINLLGEYPELEVSYNKTNATANGANDGTITLIISGGSGTRTYEWEDGAITQNRVGLAPGFYSVIVTDTITGEVELIENIQISEPVVEPDLSIGTVLEIPPLNSLYFIVDPIEPDNISTFQALDNVMFCKQRYGLFEPARYYQKVCKVDSPVVQFNSDFSNHAVDLLNTDGDIVKSFAVNLVEQNIGKSVTYPISIQYHSVGKSRVYFAAGTPPIPVEVGETFEILNNVDGFNGNYTITDIIFDSLRGYSYMVINLNYAIVNTSSNAMGRFLLSSTDYNVFESQIVMTELEDGIYQVRVRAYDSEGDGQKIGYSEPILLKEVHENTVLIEYRNFDNAFNMLWSLGYIGRKRVEGILGHRRAPGGERATTRNSSYDLIKTSSKKTRGVPFEVVDIPPYLYEVLCVIVDLDFFSINKVEFQTAESFGQAQVQDKYLLVSATAQLEQIGWFRTYNNDDIGTVNETGFIISDGGLVKSS